MATKAELLKKCEALKERLKERNPIIRITADGSIEELSPRKAAHLLAKAEAKRSGRIVTLIIRTH